MVFVAFCVTTVVVAIDQRWSIGRTALALGSAVPPLFTVLLDVHAERRGWLGTSWRLREARPERTLDRPVGWVLCHPAAGLVAGAGIVVSLTGLALWVGPPAG